jgi:hypothetical protein
LLHPYNNHFAIWINDKLTLKYMLNTPKYNLNKLMPEYYLYIENDGCYTYLMDTPEKIPRNDKYILNLLIEKRKLALKPNRGQGGEGFLKLEYSDGKVQKNGIIINELDFSYLLNQLNGYIVTEYIEQNSELNKIFDGGSECTLRIVMFQNKWETFHLEKKYYCQHSFARFGTKLSGVASNLAQGGVGIKYDFETGEFDEKYFAYRHFCKDDNIFFKNHPDSMINLKGEKLPNYEIVNTTIKNICQYFSSLEYLGFDFIITDESVKLIEINSFPANFQEIFGPLLIKDPTKSFFELKMKEKGII